MTSFAVLIFSFLLKCQANMPCVAEKFLFFKSVSWFYQPTAHLGPAKSASNSLGRLVCSHKTDGRSTRKIISQKVWVCLHDSLFRRYISDRWPIEDSYTIVYEIQWKWWVIDNTIFLVEIIFCSANRPGLVWNFIFRNRFCESANRSFSVKPSWAKIARLTPINLRNQICLLTLIGSSIQDTPPNNDSSPITDS